MKVVSGSLIYEGKAKKLFSIEGDQNKILLEYKDSLTAFNALKKGSFESKGSVNRDIASLIFQFLEKKGIKSHWVSDEGNNWMVVNKVEIIPIEVVVRNILAGSTAKKLGIEEGRVLKKPLVEFYYKNDELQDPFMSDDQVLMLEIATENEIHLLKKMALSVNEELIKLFDEIGLRLIDFKIELGRDRDGTLVLADEITPDCCRLWDIKTNEKLDKDRFRRDLGGVQESYMEVLKRLKNKLKEP